jgi:hypothetical protein
VSLHDYKAGRAIFGENPPFYALIQAAMRGADTENLAQLQAAWPEVWAELEARYNAPAGRLPGDPAT